MFSFAVWGGVVIFLGVILQNKKLLHISAKLWSKTLLKFSFIKVTVLGKENFPKEPVIYACNHQSSADIVILLATLPTGFRFIIKEELFKIPMFGIYLKLAGYPSVARESVRSIKAMGKAKNILRSGSSILVFPEGTRSKSGKLLPFKKGALFLAFVSKAKVVPVAISGSNKIMPPKKHTLNPCPVKIKIGKAISLKHQRENKDYDGAIKIVREAISELLESPGK
jgi:1-acyl-sn-glycerol-3-phosphate acyltransferase